MFLYSDPTALDRLEQEGDALLQYRSRLHAEYVASARLPNSGFTLLDAFVGLNPATDSIPWQAFPLTANQSDQLIDQNRFSRQDEYVEWQVERKDGKVSRIVFTTEFPEYFEVLAGVGTSALVRAIQVMYPNSDPTSSELFGEGINPDSLSADGRAAAFRLNLKLNPWNNGKKGILCLTHPANTLGALFNLVGQCAVPNPNIDPGNACEAVSDSGACGPGRASDPAVCSASQRLAREPRALSLKDPAGVRITSLGGIWKVGGHQVDINDHSNNHGSWLISRNGRRGVLDLRTGVTQADSPVLTGAQVARFLNVAADVVSAPDAKVPAWAKLGQESSRIIA